MAIYTEARASWETEHTGRSGSHTDINSVAPAHAIWSVTLTEELTEERCTTALRGIGGGYLFQEGKSTCINAFLSE
jgi:hypothetical protein